MKKKLNTRSIVLIAMLGAVSAILMVLDFNVPLAPGFIKMDFSDLPILIGGFIFGPLQGLIIVALKILLNLMFKPTTTAFVGELSNFILSAIFMTTASAIYRKERTKKGAAKGMIIATLITSLGAIATNVFIIFPMYAAMFGMQVSDLVAMVSAVNPWVKDVVTMAIFSLLPFNLFKYGMISLITFIIYKKISVIIHRYIQ